jgi:hypothetical protein
VTPSESETNPAWKKVRNAGVRLVIALGSWFFAGIGVLSSVIFAGAGIAGASTSVNSLLAFIPVAAWVALAVMTVRWVQGRHCHWLWPVLGTLCGLTSAGMFIWVFYVYVAAIPLAIYLVWWHLVRGSCGEGSA